MEARLTLEDGRTFPCRSFTGPGEASGEVVFNTSMTGYQEVLTDPSYSGQMVTMTYPLVGNYGVNPRMWSLTGFRWPPFWSRSTSLFPATSDPPSPLPTILSRPERIGC
jgi:carbamoyl-phosphate synthase small subunit